MNRPRLVATWLFAAVYAVVGPMMLASALAEGRVDIGGDEAWIVARADNPVLFFGHLVVMGIAWIGLTGFAVWGAVRVVGGLATWLRYGSRRIVPAPGPDATPLLIGLAVAVFALALSGMGWLMLYGAATEGRVVQMCGRRCHSDTFDRLVEPGAFGVAVSEWVLVMLLTAPLCVGAVAVGWRSLCEWIRGEYW